MFTQSLPHVHQRRPLKIVHLRRRHYSKLVYQFLIASSLVCNFLVSLRGNMRQSKYNRITDNLQLLQISQNIGTV